MDNLVTAVLSALDRLDPYKLQITSICTYSRPQQVHMDLEAFLENFSNYKAIDRDMSEYPIELSEVVDGVKFFCVCSVEDFHASSI